MANSLGQLIVRLGLDAAEFTAGLTKSEFQAKRFAENLSRGVETAAKGAAVAIGAIAAASGAAAIAIDQLVKQAGNFQDLAEKTGANAEALASFAVSAEVAGVGIEGVAAASVKLTKALSGVDDESKGVGKALAAIGIPIKEFKQLDPASQIETVAKALAGFEDGAEKTAVAIALFGKSGADLLPFLKELAAQGGRQVILTAEQIRQADEYADSQARLIAQVRLHAQALATQVLPAVTNVIEAAKKLVEQWTGVGEATSKLARDGSITTWANNAAMVLAYVVDAAQGISRIFEVTGERLAALAAAAGAVASGEVKRALGILKDYAKRRDDILTAPLFSQILAKQIADANESARLRAQEDRGFTPKGKRVPGLGGDDDKKTKEKKDAVEDYIKSLEKQLRATENLNAEETAKLAIDEMILAGVKNLNDVNKARILVLARELDAREAAKEAAKEEKRLEEERARARERYTDAVQKDIASARGSAQQQQQTNEQMREQLIMLRGGEEAVKEYTIAKNEKIAADLEEYAIIQELAVVDAEIVKSIRDQAAAYRERNAIIREIDVAAQMRKEAEAMQEVRNMFADTFADAFSDFISGTKSAKDAFRSFVDDIARQISRIAAQNIANKIFGGNTQGGPDIFGMIAKFLPMLFGGSAAGGGSVYGGPQFGSYAAGGVASGWSLVGERGPEMINLPPATRVYNANDTRSMMGARVQSVTINQSIQHLVSTQTGRQAAKMAGQAASISMRRG